MPSKVRYLRITVRGGATDWSGTGGYWFLCGKGGTLRATLRVTPGEIYRVDTFPGGGNRSQSEGSAPNKLKSSLGASTVAFGPNLGSLLTQSTLWMIAGAGGGNAGIDNNGPVYIGGAGGGDTGASGGTGPGYGGGQSSGGDGNGQALAGGMDTTGTGSFARAGGGAGWYGGGAGGAGSSGLGAGGGGSSKIQIPSDRSPTTVENSQGTWPNPAIISDADYRWAQTTQVLIEY